MTETSDLTHAIEQLGGASIMVLGDLMLDRFVYGEVERISPEAPVPVLRVGSEESMLGGAGNVVRNLVALGAQCCFVAVVGDDAIGRDLISMVGEEANIEPYLLVERGRRSTTKVRYVAGSQQLLRADRETDRAIEAATCARIVDIVETGLEGIDAMVLSDYAKGVLTPEVIEAAIAAARDAGIPVIVDPKSTDFGRYRGATVLTPNRRELAIATRMIAETDAEVVEAAARALEDSGADMILVTRSADGMSLVCRDGTVTHLEAQAREVFDVSGAGDTVVASFAAALGRGIGAADAARIANLAGGIVVGKVGTAVIHAEDLTHALRTSTFIANEEKVLVRSAAVEQVARWRKQGRRLGFTNGCFDLLHPGHVSLLRQARARCDRLVVGLNSDRSVRELKGPSRPVQEETSRAQVLASLADVDAVVIFDEETPIALIEALRPDLLVKGADYTVETVVGADIVTAYGGDVFLADLAAGHSTTATISRLRV